MLCWSCGYIGMHANMGMDFYPCEQELFILPLRLCCKGAPVLFQKPNLVNCTCPTSVCLAALAILKSKTHYPRNQDVKFRLHWCNKRFFDLLYLLQQIIHNLHSSLKLEEIALQLLWEIWRSLVFSHKIYIISLITS